MESFTPFPRNLPSPWPAGFAPVPDEPWAKAPVDPFALGYDRLGSHGWYSNLEPTVEEVAGWLDGGALVVDHSGGTGLLADRLLAARPGTRAGILNADASGRFLRLAAEKARGDPRLAFRLLPFAGGRVRDLADAAPELAGRIGGIACANAVHLYPDVREAAASWHEMLRPGGRLHVQSGNLAHGDGGAWIIDATVGAVDREARRLVADGPEWARHRDVLADAGRMEAYDAVRRRWFPPVRSAGETVAAIAAAGFGVERVRHRDVTVDTAEWAEFLGVYHEGVLPWVGGCKETDGRPAGAADVRDRLRLISKGLRAAVGGPSFRASWTYVDAAKP
jgi:SAM-dependent methyltransferase